EAEERTDHELAVGVARGHLLPRPAEVLDQEVVEEGQAVERAAHDGEEGEERGEDGQELLAARVAARGLGHALAVALARFSRSASGCAWKKGSRGKQPDTSPLRGPLVQSLKVRQMSLRFRPAPPSTSAGRSG